MTYHRNQIQKSYFNHQISVLEEKENSYFIIFEAFFGCRRVCQPTSGLREHKYTFLVGMSHNMI